MAILSKFLVASSVFSAVALAAPLVQRDMVTDMVTETVWTTVDVTTTIYDNGVPATVAPATTTTSGMQMLAADLPTSTPTTLVPMFTSSAPAALFFTTTATKPAGGWSTTAAAAAPSAAFANKPMFGSTTANCEGPHNACVGDVTHWDGGLGACGTNVDTNTDLAIALPVTFMGSLSNNNPYCGRTVTLYNPTSGMTVQAIVKDKCMGCVNRAIDCTNILFDQITNGQGNGRTSGIEWWLN
jgi:hypothetical protein